MKKLFVLSLAAASLALASCGVSNHLTTNRNASQTNVNLERANYRVVGTVEGKAEATYILGIGGLSRKAIEANAHADMLKNADMKGAQAVVNISTEEKFRGLAPFYIKRETTARGQVVEFSAPRPVHRPTNK